MITLNRLNGTSIIVNAELIESVEATPDTVLTLTTGKKLVVVDSVDEIVARVIAYKKIINSFSDPIKKEE